MTHQKLRCDSSRSWNQLLTFPRNADFNNFKPVKFALRDFIVLSSQLYNFTMFTRPYYYKSNGMYLAALLYFLTKLKVH